MPSLLKELIYKETRKSFEGANSIVFIDFNTFTQPDSITIRAEAKKINATARVIKNSISIRVLNDLGVEGSDAILKGSVLALVGEEPVGISKVAADFNKKNKKGEPLGGVVEGKLVSADEVKALSKLPSKEVLIGQFVNVVAAPLRGLVTVLNGNIRGLAVAMNAIKEKKEKESV